MQELFAYKSAYLSHLHKKVIQILWAFKAKKRYMGIPQFSP